MQLTLRELRSTIKSVLKEMSNDQTYDVYDEKASALYTVSRFDPQQNMDDEFEFTVSGEVSFDVLNDEGAMSPGNFHIENLSIVPFDGTHPFPVQLTPEEETQARQELVKKAFSSWYKKTARTYGYNEFQHP